MAKLTDAFIRSLQVPEGAKDVQAFDDSCPGFGVRKFAKGHGSYFVKYTVGKQQRRKTLGPFVAGALAAIRKEAAVVLAQARLGTDVQVLFSSSSGDFCECCAAKKGSCRSFVRHRQPNVGQAQPPLKVWLSASAASGP
jgi:Arm DNA-binding domain